MTDFLAAYQTHLETDRRFHPELVQSYLSALPELLQSQRLSSPAELTKEEVLRIWQQQRWEETSFGIRSRDVSRDRKLIALRSFLRYMEEECRALPNGMHSIIQVEDAHPDRLGGLTSDELNRLKLALIQNISTCNQRRETALIFLICETGLPLDTLLELRVGRNGLITANGKSGDFVQKGGRFYLRAGKQLLPLSNNVIHFINFYLENRRHRTVKLFVKGNGKDAAGHWPVVSALRSLTRFFKQLDISIPKGRLLDVLQATAEQRIQNSQKDNKSRRQLALPLYSSSRRAA